VDQTTFSENSNLYPALYFRYNGINQPKISEKDYHDHCCLAIESEWINHLHSISHPMICRFREDNSNLFWIPLNILKSNTSVIETLQKM
jgi:hypothetical protein